MHPVAPLYGGSGAQVTPQASAPSPYHHPQGVIGTDKSLGEVSFHMGGAPLQPGEIPSSGGYGMSVPKRKKGKKTRQSRDDLESPGA